MGFGGKMDKRQILEELRDKLSEIYHTLLNPQKKSKELNNFFIGIILGVGIAMVIQGIFNVLLSIQGLNDYSNTLLQYNITLNNLPIPDKINFQIQQQRLSSSWILSMILFFVGLGFFFLAIFMYLFTNKDLMYNHYVYEYKVRKGIKLIELIRKDFNKDFFSNKNVVVKDSYDYEKKITRVIIYHRIWRLIMGNDYINNVTIHSNKIVIFCPINKFCYLINQKLKTYLTNLKNKGILTELNLIKKD